MPNYLVLKYQIISTNLLHLLISDRLSRINYMDNCTNYLLLRHFHVVIPNPSLVWIGSNSLQSILDTPIYFGLAQIWTNLYLFPNIQGSIVSPIYFGMDSYIGSNLSQSIPI